ncbi:extracellular solute-binding protein [Pseudooceanicola sp.]|uniref:extracellular solute-binding protein n=1 Tax=Pseudooceanicola sp. TaxID=1914328 RepID=UPI00263470DA|nr:extracellular solute-binding protein [Pseudooceanicola sp.]MDF1855116.1 extracellular solute-binding protein [Pseudooceanicola sp.]
MLALPLAAQDSTAQDSTTQDGGAEVIKSHGFNDYNELKYPADFPHFDYVNPEAPKGGEIALATQGTFDSLNPYTRKGRAAALTSVMFESLLDGTAPADEYGTSYCLLCESLEYDAGKTWVIFHMRKDARFSDGTPLTAHDVVFTHNLFLEQGLPSYAVAVKKRITGAEALDDYTVRFTFADGISRKSLIDQVGGTPVFSKKWFDETGARLDEPRLITSPGSGPYVIDNFEVNRRIVYKRNPDYWGKDLPVNIGRHNFDRIRIEYFADETAAFEAFKAGEYTMRVEGNSKLWATAYDFPAAQRGLVVKEELPDGSPPPASGFIFNLGREALKDIKVREALALAYNFEWTNESLQYGLFSQRESFIQGTPLAATGVAEGVDLDYLQSLGDLVPPEVLGEPVRVPHTSSPEKQNDRRNLRKAMKLLDEAGWLVGSDGMRRNAAGDLLHIEIPVNSAGAAVTESVIETLVQNMRLMGVDAQMEKVDPAQYTNRERDRDYDILLDSYRTFLGVGTGLNQVFGSAEAAFSLFNPAGLADPLVDAIIQKGLASETLEQENTTLRVLDRVLRHIFFVVPVWYKANHWVAYWDMYDHPDEIAPFDLGYLDYWWYVAEKGEQLRATGALR